METIEHYQSIKPLQKEFVLTIDKYGKHIFRQIKREGDICLYERKKLSGKFSGYELFKTKLIKAGEIIFYNFVNSQDFERYPRAGDISEPTVFIDGDNAKEIAEKYFEIWTKNPELTAKDLVRNDEFKKQIDAIINK